MDCEDPVLAQLAGRIRGAQAEHAALDIRGGGTKEFYGEARTGEPLDVTGLKGISSYEPTELVVTARAGTPLAELEAVLEESGQHLPFEPPRFSSGGTVGGMVAAGLSGPARVSAGAVRDHVLGVTLLNGLGEVLTFGGQVAKNVAGYDLSRLIAGSLGILGIICEVSLKVMPVSPAAATLTFDCDENQALAQLGQWAAQPWPLIASAWYEGRLSVRLAGAKAAVSSACRKLGGTSMPGEAAAAWWLRLRDHRDPFFLPDAASLARGESLWRLSVPRTTAPIQLPGRQLIEWHGAQRWWRTAADGEDVRATAARAGGHATLIRGADRSVGVFAPVSGVVMRIHRGLKRAFDPARVLNPGRLYADL